MTLLHQAAQKAVEAKQREAFEHWYSDAGRWPKSVARGEDGHYLLAQANSSYEAWRAAAAALQQQPEPVAPNEWAAEAATVMAQFIHLSAQPERDAWAQNASRAIRLLNAPALQHQEEPREPVATLRVTLEYDDEDGPLEIVCHGTELNMRRLDARLKFLHRLEKQSNDCAASPSTTRQQEVGSGFWWCAQCQCEVPSRSVTYEETHDVRAGGCGHPVGDIPAAPSTPEKAGGVSDGVGGNDGR